MDTTEIIPQPAMGPRRRSRLVTRLGGSDLANNADVFVPMDNIVGGPMVTPEGRYNHILYLLIRVVGTVTSVAATMDNAMPGTLLRSILTDIRFRAAGQDWIDGGELDGEDASTLFGAVAHGDAYPTPADVPDADGTPSTGDIWIAVPFVTNYRDLFGREGDEGIPLAALDRMRDPQAGLRFRNKALGASFKGFSGVTHLSITAVEVHAVLRANEKPNVIMPALKASSEQKSSFELMPADGSERGTHAVALIFDPPNADTGVRSHAGYSNITLRFGQDGVLSAESAADLVDSFNNQELAFPGSSAHLGRTAPHVLPLITAQADASFLEHAFGRCNIAIGTRTTNAQRILQMGRAAADEKVAQHINKVLGKRFNKVVTKMGSPSDATMARIASVGVQTLAKAEQKTK